MFKVDPYTNYCLYNISYDNLLIDENEITQEESRFANKFVFERDQQNFIKRRGFLRKIISEIDKVDPLSIQFEKTVFGKLTVKNSFHFNISTSKLRFALLIGPCELGVDIEEIKEHNLNQQIMDKYFTKAEQQYCNDQNFDVRFLELWTKKESFIKQIGTGLTDDLLAVDVLEERVSYLTKEYHLKTTNYNNHILSTCTMNCEDKEIKLIVD